MLSLVCFFLFNQSKNNAVLEPRTGHFRGLVDFEAKAKDLKLYSRGQGRKDVLEDSTSAGGNFQHTNCSVDVVSSPPPDRLPVVKVVVCYLETNSSRSRSFSTRCRFQDTFGWLCRNILT